MNIKLDDIKIKDLSTGDIFSKISSAFGVICDTDGKSIILDRVQGASTRSNRAYRIAFATCGTHGSIYYG